MKAAKPSWIVRVSEDEGEEKELIMSNKDIAVPVMLERMLATEATIVCKVDEIDPTAWDIVSNSEEKPFAILDKPLKQDRIFPENDLSKIDREDNADSDDCKAVARSEEILKK